LLTLAGVGIAAPTKQAFQAHRTTGTGKSTAIRELLGAAWRAAIAPVFPPT